MSKKTDNINKEEEIERTETSKLNEEEKISTTNNGKNETNDIENSDIHEETSTENLLIRKRDLLKSWLIWENFPQTNYNYERMHGTAVAHSFVPISKRLYQNDPEGKKKMMERQSQFFNVHIEFGAVIIGLIIALEEQIAKGAKIPGDFVTSIKTSMMGPLAGVGDTIMQGVIIPILLAIFIDLTVQTQSIWGSVAYTIAIIAIAFGISYTGFRFGYTQGAESVMDFLEEGTLDTILKGAEIMGTMVMGGLIANYVVVHVPLEISTSATTFNIQTEFLDAVMPGILPLGFTLLIYWLLKKGWNTNKILLLIVAVGVIGGLTGILGGVE